MDNIIEVQGFTPHADQSKKLDIILNGTQKYISLITGRQWGKSVVGENLLLKWALENHDAVCMWVSPVYSQAKKVFTELVSALGDTGLTTDTNKSELFIKFINGTIIYFRSGERPDTLRGYTLDYLIIDEAAFIKDEVWNQVLKQTVLVRGKKVLFLSTPKGKNWLYNIYIRGLNQDEPTYISLHGTSYDTPYITEVELLEAKLSLPDNIYRQEILAEFIDDGGEVFNNLNQVCSLTHYPNIDANEKYYAGLDFGRQNDYTVLCILNSQGKMVDFYRARQKSWDIIISEVLVLLRKYKPQIYAEVNSIGDVLFETIKKQYAIIQPFITNQDTKQNMIEDLIMGINEDKLLLPNQTLNNDLYNELSQFTYEYSPKSRKVRYGAPSGFHDDCVISLALSFQALKRKVNAGKYVIK
jgi:PBSX family phage terminase large subunit